MKTVMQKVETLDKVLYYLPKMIFFIIIGIRILVAIPLIIVSIHKFQFLNNQILAIIMGVGSILLIEFSLILTSLLTANFRKNISKKWATGILIVAILITVYTGVLIQLLSQVYSMQLPLTVFLTLHLLNIMSIVFSESVGFLLKNTEKIAMQLDNTIIATQQKTAPIATLELQKVAENTQIPQEILQQLETVKTTKEKIWLIQDFFNTDVEIANFLNVNKSTISRNKKVA